MGEIIISVPKRKKSVQIIKSETALNEFLEQQKEDIKKRYGIAELNETKEITEIEDIPTILTWEGLEQLEEENIPTENVKEEVIFDIDLEEIPENVKEEVYSDIISHAEMTLSENIKDIVDIEIEDNEPPPSQIIFTEIYTIADEKEPIQITNDIKNTNLVDAEYFAENIQTAYQNGYNDAKEVALLEARDKIIEAHSFIKRIDNFMAELRKHYVEQINYAKNKIIDIALTVAEVILDEEINRNKNTIINQINKIIDEINNEKVFSIRINPDDYDILVEAKTDIISPNNKIANFIKDDTIQKGSCILNTAIGTIDATFSKQLNKLFDEIKIIEKEHLPTKEELITSAIPDIIPITEELLMK